MLAQERAEHQWMLRRGGARAQARERSQSRGCMSESASSSTSRCELGYGSETDYFDEDDSNSHSNSDSGGGGGGGGGLLATPRVVLAVLASPILSFVGLKQANDMGEAEEEQGKMVEAKEEEDDLIFSDSL